jgi:Kdo2-lipid IVA lauroyltransferase/acyltransferase
MKNAIEYTLVRGLYRAARGLSFRTATGIGKALGTFAYRILGFRKAVTLDNLRHAFPESTEEERRAIALGAYRSYGKAMVQAFWTAGASKEDLVAILTIADETPLRQALAEGKGVLLLSGHFGSWELLASSFRLRTGAPNVVIAQTQRNRRVGELVDGIRARFDVEVVPMGMGTREVIRALRNGKVIGLLGDKSGPKESVFVNFFGRPAATHRGTAALALKLRVPILFVAIVRQPDETYRAEYQPIDYSDLRDSSEETIRQLTQRHVAVLERYIRLHPDQWLWMHKRWKHTAEYETRHPHAAATDRQELPA